MHTQALTDDERRMAEENIGLARVAALRLLPSGKAVGMDWNELYSAACEGLLRGVRRYDPTISKPGPYLYGSCRFAVMNAMRDRRRANGGAVPLSLDTPVCEDIPDMTFGDLLPARVDVEAEVVLRIAFQQALAVCTPREQEAGNLYAHGLSEREIAKEMGVSQARVNLLIHSIRRRIAEQRKDVAE